MAKTQQRRGMSGWLFLAIWVAAAGAPALAAAGNAERGSRLIGQERETAKGARVRLQDVLVHRRTGVVLQAIDAAGERVGLETFGFAPAAPRARADGEPALPLRELVGGSIANATGDRIGQVEEVVLDRTARKVDYLVVRFDKEWLGTSKRTAVPLRALRGRSVDGAWSIDADPARALSLPELRREDLRRIDEEDVVQQVHRMLGRTPWLRSDDDRGLPRARR